MGYYLDSKEPFTLYEETVNSPYFVDKSLMIGELLNMISTREKHICITRPRRFGKSVAAAMIGAFFTRGIDSSSIFDNLKISENPLYRKYMNQYHVIYINFLKAANISRSYDEFMGRIEQSLSKDLKKAFPDAELWEKASVTDNLTVIYSETGEKFILIMDEWDCIFHKKYTTDDNRREFIGFLSALTKDAGYLALTYMTGVLPIAKYSSGSSINHFREYTMADNEKFGTYFGFTKKEVDALYNEYMANERDPEITREELDFWYDGYSTKKVTHIYNPRSIVCALSDNQTGSYWSQTGSFSELSSYIINDIDGVKSAVAQMLAGESVPVLMQEYAASAMKLDTRDRILSAMVIYGFLTYDGDSETVRIPNWELMKEFKDTIREEHGMGYVNRLARISDEILKATLNADEDAVARALADVHKDTPIMAYNSEAELATVVYFAYLSALDAYEIKREDAAGRGYADFVFIPRDGKSDGIIIELKKDRMPEDAIRQIKERHYADAFRERLGEEKKWDGKRILAVGITYDSVSGGHRCMIEELPVE